MGQKLTAPFTPEVKAILSFIGSRKRTVFTYENTSLKPMALHSYWDGGSRPQYALWRNGRPEYVTVNGHPYFDASGRNPTEYVPQDGDILIRHGIVAGKPAIPSFTYFRKVED